MGDLATFRIARSVQNTRPDERGVFRPLTASAIATPLLQRTWQKQKYEQQAAIDEASARDVLAEPPPQAAAPLLAAVEKLDSWLVAAGNQPPVRALAERAAQLATDAGGARFATDDKGPWKALKQHLVDRVVASAVLARPVPGDAWATGAAVESAAAAGRATRLLLVAGLVEAAQGDVAPRTPADVYALLADRVLALPDALLRLVRPRRPRDALARRPGFADLYVLRSEWSWYVPGEIAHIENVMAGELKERVHTRVDERDVTTTAETQARELSEHSTQSTDRFSLETETSRQTELAVAIEGSVDTSGQYGLTRVNTHLGGSFDYSVAESRRLATTQAREVVARAVSTIERQVRETRTTRSLTRVTDENTHLLDATDRTDHVVAVYRWVDKIERVQLFRYPHRYLLEFQVPEPAAYLHWVRNESAARAPRGPVPFTVDGVAGSRPLSVRDVDRDSYPELAARYGAADIPPPPDEQRTVVATVLLDAEPPAYDHDRDVNVRAAPLSSKSVEVALPDGYHATGVRASVSMTPALARWGDRESDNQEPHADSTFRWRWGYHFPRTDVLVGDVLIELFDPNRDTVAAASTKFGNGWLAWTSTERSLQSATGTLVVAATAGGSYRTAVTVTIRCSLTREASDRWAADAYARIHAAYLDQQKEHEELTSGAFAAPSWQIDSDSPEANRQTIVDELKRQVVTMLLGEDFDGFPAVDRSREPGGPRIDVEAALATTPYVQFLEQAFEWENLTYVCYPYYWGARERWDDALMLRGTDPELTRFLRAGSARVVVPARPGMEPALQTFLELGVLWGGGPAPTVDEPGYVSVANEIRSLRRAPDGGEPGESWETRLPTTLVWLDPDPAIPKRNAAAQLAEPEEPLFRAVRGG